MEIKFKVVSQVPEQCMCTTNLILHSRLCIFKSSCTPVAKKKCKASHLLKLALYVTDRKRWI